MRDRVLQAKRAQLWWCIVTGTDTRSEVSLLLLLLLVCRIPAFSCYRVHRVLMMQRRPVSDRFIWIERWTCVASICDSSSIVEVSWCLR